MYGRIVRKMKSQGFTDLREVFCVLGNAMQYNWLLSSYECYPFIPGKIPHDKDYVWLAGDEFMDIVEEYNIQFIWGIAAAFNKNITLEEVLQYPIADAQEYVGYYQQSLTMQNPLADMEIYPIDSSFLIIVSKSQEVIEKFANEYSDSENLVQYNRKALQ